MQSRGLLTFPSQVSFRLPDGTPAVIPFITGNALANLLLGLPLVTGGARLDNHQHLRTESYNFFVNDSIRVTPRLTLSAGLRYEYNSPPVDAEDRANIYDPATGTLVQVGTNGVPRAGYDSDKNNFAPRVGLAWALGTRDGDSRGLRRLLRPVAARAGRRAVFQRALLRLPLLLPTAAGAADDLQSVPVQHARANRRRRPSPSSATCARRTRSTGI